MDDCLTACLSKASEKADILDGGDDRIKLGYTLMHRYVQNVADDKTRKRIFMLKPQTLGLCLLGVLNSTNGIACTVHTYIPLLVARAQPQSGSSSHNLLGATSLL